jgi:hypothetical protein
VSDDYFIAVEAEPKPADMTLVASAVLWGGAVFFLGLLAAYLLHHILPPPPNYMAVADRILSSRNWFTITFAAIFWAPLWETIVGQMLPVELLRRFKAPHILILVACGAVFGIGHYFSNGLIHALRSVIAGILLGELYCRYRKHSVGSSYLAVVIAHAFNNLCVVTIIALGLAD